MGDKETRATIRSIESDIIKIFPEIGKKYGYTLKFGNGSFDEEGNFKMKIEGLKDGGLSPEAQMYNMLVAYDPSLPPLHTRLKFAGSVYAITGTIKGGRYIIGEAGLKRYKLPVGAVKLYWKIQKESIAEEVKV